MNNCWPNVFKLTDPTLGDFWMRSQFGGVNWLTCGSPQEYLFAYENCPPLSSVINKKASAFAAGEIELINPSTGKELRGAFKEWEDFFENPNHIQSQNQFFKQLYIYVALMGYAYVLEIKPVGFPDAPPDAWWVIPAEHLEIIPISMAKYPPAKGQKFREVWFNFNGRRTKLRDENLILFTDSGSPIIDPQTLLPFSRIRNLRYPITNITGSYESRAVLIQSRGAMGILSSAGSADAVGPLPLTPIEKEDIQNQYRKYGLSQDQWQVIITQASLKWQPMVLDINQL